MEIKPEGLQEIDRKDFRYKRHVSDKGLRIMNKKAYEHLVGLVLSKQAAVQTLPASVGAPNTNNRWAGLRQMPASNTIVSASTRNNKDPWSASNWRAHL